MDSQHVTDLVRSLWHESNEENRFCWNCWQFLDSNKTLESALVHFSFGFEGGVFLSSLDTPPSGSKNYRDVNAGQILGIQLGTEYAIHLHLIQNFPMHHMQKSRSITRRYLTYLTTKMSAHRTHPSLHPFWHPLFLSPSLVRENVRLNATLALLILQMRSVIN